VGIVYLLPCPEQNLISPSSIGQYYLFLTRKNTSVKMKLLAHRPELPGNVISFLIVLLYPT
jgi:hypothetical protein